MSWTFFFIKNPFLIMVYYYSTRNIFLSIKRKVQNISCLSFIIKFQKNKKINVPLWNIYSKRRTTSTTLAEMCHMSMTHFCKFFSGTFYSLNWKWIVFYYPCRWNLCVWVLHHISLSYYLRQKVHQIRLICRRLSRSQHSKARQLLPLLFDVAE